MWLTNDEAFQNKNLWRDKLHIYQDTRTTCDLVQYIVKQVLKASSEKLIEILE